MTAPADTPLFEEFAARFAEALREDDPVSGDLFDPPTAEFRPVRLGSWRWVRRNLNPQRLFVGGASTVVFAALAVGRWFL